MQSGALQRAVYARLVAEAPLMALIKAVYAPKAPQDADGASNTPFAYVVVPQINFAAWDTKDYTGASAVVQVDIYDRSQSELSIRSIQDATYTALNRRALTISGAVWVDTLFETAISGYEDEGKTRRVIMLFRVTYMEAAS